MYPESVVSIVYLCHKHDWAVIFLPPNGARDQNGLAMSKDTWGELVGLQHDFLASA